MTTKRVGIAWWCLLVAATLALAGCDSGPGDVARLAVTRVSATEFSWQVSGWEPFEIQFKTRGNDTMVTVASSRPFAGTSYKARFDLIVEHKGRTLKIVSHDSEIMSCASEDHPIIPRTTELRKAPQFWNHFYSLATIDGESCLWFKAQKTGK